MIQKKIFRYKPLKSISSISEAKKKMEVPVKKFREFCNEAKVEIDRKLIEQY